MIYKWKPQAGIKLNAKVVGEHLEKLRVKHNGHLTPPTVLNDAKSKASPLHGAFQWDNTKAAGEFRLWQARHLINSIVVEIKDAKPGSNVRAFVNIRVEKKQSYTSRAHAMSEADMRKQMLSTAWHELLSWKMRYADFDELAPILRLIDQLSKNRKAA